MITLAVYIYGAIQGAWTLNQITMFCLFLSDIIIASSLRGEPPLSYIKKEVRR